MLKTSNSKDIHKNLTSSVAKIIVAGTLILGSLGAGHARDRDITMVTETENWAGISLISEKPNFNEIKATLRIPDCTFDKQNHVLTQSVSMWIGLGGFENPSHLIQIGVIKSNTEGYWSPFYEMLPSSIIIGDHHIKNAKKIKVDVAKIDESGMWRLDLYDGKSMVFSVDTNYDINELRSADFIVERNMKLSDGKIYDLPNCKNAMFLKWKVRTSAKKYWYHRFEIDPANGGDLTKSYMKRDKIIIKQLRK